jgi:hypothetical protein
MWGASRWFENGGACRWKKKMRLKREAHIFTDLAAVYPPGPNQLTAGRFFQSRLGQPAPADR